MARMFNVAVDVRLIDRVSRDIGIIGRGFTSAERRVQSLQRALDGLQTKHGLYVQRARMSQQIDRDATIAMQRRLGVMQSMAQVEANAGQAKLAALQAEAAEKARLGRMQAEQLSGARRQAALADIAAQEQADAATAQQLQQRLATQSQARQLRMTEMQAAIQRRTSMAQIKANETNNRILRERQAIKEQNLELSEAQIAAQREQRMRILMRGGIAAGVMAVVAGGLAKAGMPVGISEFRARMAGGLTAAQAAGLGPFATQIALQSRLFSRNQVLESLGPMIGILGLRRTRGLAPGFFRTAAIEQALTPEAETPAEMIPELLRAGVAIGARTPGQFRAFNRTVANVLLRSGGAMGLSRISEIMRTVGPIGAAMPFGQRMQLGEAVSLLSLHAGGEGALAPGALARFFQSVMVQSSGRNIAFTQLLGLVHNRTLPGIFGALMKLHGRQVPLAERFMGRENIHTLLALQSLPTGLLQQVMKQLQPQVTTAQALTKALQTAQPKFHAFVKSMETLGSVLGAPWARYLGDVAGVVGRAANVMARGMQAHPEMTRALAVGGLPRLLFDALEASFQKISANMGFPNQPIHVAVHIDGKKVAHVVAKHTMNQLKQKTSVHGVASPIGVSPALYGGKP